MKMKNIFSSRKSKKKKTIQQATPSSDVSSNDKLIISQDSTSSVASEGKENGCVKPSSVLDASPADDDVKVVLRQKPKNQSERDYEIVNKARTSSTSSNNSVKARSRRPWSFIDQLRRQNSKETNPSSSARTSQMFEDLISATPPTQDEACLLPGVESAYFAQGIEQAASTRSSYTLPRSINPEDIVAQGSGDRYRPSSRSTRGQRDAQAGVHEPSKRPRTIDFRFFQFFKRSNSGDSFTPSSPADSVSPADSLPSSERSSLRGKNKNKKKTGSKKRREAQVSKNHVTLPPSEQYTRAADDLRLRSMSDGSETSKIVPTCARGRPSSEFYDNSRLNAVSECVELATKDKRVPVNGEPAFYLGDQVDSRPSSVQTLTGIDSPLRGRNESDPPPTINRHVEFTESQPNLFGDPDGSGRINLMRSSSSSTESSSSRRSSFVCEPRDSPLPEGSVATFSVAAGPGARSKEFGPRDPKKIHRTHSNEMAKEASKLSVQTRCSQSVSNLAISSTLSILGPSQSIGQLPRSSSDAEKSNSNRRFPQPSPHQQKQEQNSELQASISATHLEVAPPSPVLRAIGYPSVVLRRNKHKRNKLRPNSAYADQRTQQVMSLNMEDLPTYSRMRLEMMKSNAAHAFPSYEDILAVRELQPVYRGSAGSSGVQYASTASGRARRRAGTYGQRSSTGFPTAASVDDLDSLSSSYGSKQSLDDDENSNLLAGTLNNANAYLGPLKNQEPSSKRVKTIRKSVVSLANLISPGKPGRNHSSNKLQRSSSFKESASATSSNTATVTSFKPYRPPSNTPNRKKNNRRSKLWCETFDHTGLSEKQIRWQEAIFELYQGERDLVQDLTMAKQTYRDSMVTLKMLKDEEVSLIFGKLGCLLPLHEELLEKLEMARGEDGRTLGIGFIFVEWFPRISTAYREYCANQSDAKYALDAAVERDARVRDFLQRCLESPFSRKLDLWSYLDLPRTRLVKYPLLLNNVLKRTPLELDEERGNLEKVMKIIGEVIERVDETTGEQQCRYIRSKLEYLDEKQRSKFVESSRLLLCSGQLKNNRGTKMHVFLFEEALMLTRQATRSNKISYQVYRSPIPLRSLVVESSEGDKLSGSFRGGILNSEKAKHSFRVRSEELNVSYTLQASEEHDRKQWINAIQDALSKYRVKHPEAYPANSAENLSALTRRRATYDPVQSVSSKKQAARAVLRTSSDKSNRSNASSTDKSLQEDSQEEDAASSTSEEVVWRRERSQTINPSLLSAKGISLSRKTSSSSSGKEEEKSKKDKKSKKGDSRGSQGKLANRLQHLQPDSDGPPSPLRPARKKNSISRHFSLSGADKAKPNVVVLDLPDDGEKKGNPCRRSRSLTSSPQMIRAVVSRFGNKRFTHAKTEAGAIQPTGGSAAKPPIGPNSSPFSIRRSPSMQASRPIHEASSTPNLLGAVRRASGVRRSSFRRESSDGIDSLRRDACGGSAMELRSAAIARRAEEAKTQRKARSHSGSRKASLGETLEAEIDEMRDSVAPLGQVEIPEPSLETKIVAENDDHSTTQSQAEEVEAVECAVAQTLHPDTTGGIAITCTPATPKASASIPSEDADHNQDVPDPYSEVVTATKIDEHSNITTEMSDSLITITSVCSDDVTNDVIERNELQSPDDVMAEFSADSEANSGLPAQNSAGDLISFGQEEAKRIVKDEELEQVEITVCNAHQDSHGPEQAGVAEDSMKELDIMVDGEEESPEKVEVGASYPENLTVSLQQEKEAEEQESSTINVDAVHENGNQMNADEDVGDADPHQDDHCDNTEDCQPDPVAEMLEESSTVSDDAIHENENQTNANAEEDVGEADLHQDDHCDNNKDSQPDPVAEMLEETESCANMDVGETSVEDVVTGEDVEFTEQGEDSPILDTEVDKEEEDVVTLHESKKDKSVDAVVEVTLSDVDNNNVHPSLPDVDKMQCDTETEGQQTDNIRLRNDNETSCVPSCRTEIDGMAIENQPGVHSSGIIGQHHIMNNNLQASV